MVRFRFSLVTPKVRTKVFLFQNCNLVVQYRRQGEWSRCAIARIKKKKRDYINDSGERMLVPPVEFSLYYEGRTSKIESVRLHKKHRRLRRHHQDFFLKRRDFEQKYHRRNATRRRRSFHRIVRQCLFVMFFYQ